MKLYNITWTQKYSTWPVEGPDFFNEDDAQTDYFHRSHYIDINIGTWNKPYALEK